MIIKGLLTSFTFKPAKMSPPFTLLQDLLMVKMVLVMSLRVDGGQTRMHSLACKLCLAPVEIGKLCFV